jgi:hypothetical protein
VVNVLRFCKRCGWVLGLFELLFLDFFDFFSKEYMKFFIRGSGRVAAGSEILYEVV